MRTIRPKDLATEIKANSLAGLATMIWGPPGQGKSQICYQAAQQEDAKVFEIRANLFDPVDIRGGLKVVEQKDGTYKTRYGIPEDYPDTNYLGNVYIVIDELPNAPKATQNGLLQLILDRKIGTYTLPLNTTIIAAGNRAEDRAAVHEMPTPVKNRFAHYTIESNIDDWVKWALTNNIDESVIAFLRYRPHLLSDIEPTHNAFPTPRTWEFVSKKLPFMKDEFYGVASLVGDGAAGEYISFKRVYHDLPDIDNLIKNPGTAKVPTDTSVLYAICGGVTSRVNKTNFKNILRYADRMPPEYGVIIVRDSISKDPTLTQEQAFTAWAEKNADVLL